MVDTKPEVAGLLEELLELLEDGALELDELDDAMLELDELDLLEELLDEGALELDELLDEGALELEELLDELLEDGALELDALLTPTPLTLIVQALPLKLQLPTKPVFSAPLAVKPKVLLAPTAISPLCETFVKV